MSEFSPEVSVSADVSSSPESSPTLDQSIDSPAPSSDTPSEAQIEKFKIKASGQDRELTRAEMERYASMGISANEKWEEAAQLRKHHDAFLKQLQSDPMSILSRQELGLDFNSLAMQHLSKQIEAELAAAEEAELTPEQRTQRQDQKELEEYRSSKRQGDEQRQAAETARANQEFEQSTRQSIQAGLQAAGLPQTQFTWNSILQYMGSAMDAGHHEVTVEDVMPYVQRDYQASFDGLFEGEDEEVLSRFSPEKIARIQAAVIKKAKGPGWNPQSQGKVEAAESPKREMSMSDWDQHIAEVKAKLKRGEI